MINNVDIEIEHSGVVKTIGEMVSDLTKGYASYWHWHTLFSKAIRLYNSAKNEEGYGILLPNELNVNGKSIGLLETEIANGVYDKDRLFKLVYIHEFLFIGDACLK